MQFLSTRKGFLKPSQFLKHLLIISLGHIVEYYDFAIFGFLAPTIAHQFFPYLSPSLSTTCSFIIFFIGFIGRSIGSFIFGQLADKYGKDKIILPALFLMGGSTLTICFLPTYHTIGVLAPILLILLRCIQGLAMGAKFTTSVVNTIEQYTHNKNRAFIGAILAASTVLGWLVGLIIVYFSLKTSPGYGWRIPFGIGVLVSLLGYLLRCYHLSGNKKPPPNLSKPSLSSHRIVKRALSLICISSFIGALFYTFIIFFPTYLMQYFSLNYKFGIMCSLYGMLSEILFLIILGWVSDRIGYFKTIITASTIFLIIALGIFKLSTLLLIFSCLVGISGNFIQRIIIVLSLIFLGITLYISNPLEPTGINFILLIIYGGFILACILAPYTALLGLSFSNYHYTAAALSYGIGTAFVGGAAPIILFYAIEYTHNLFLPAYYLIFWGILCLIGTVYLEKELHHETSIY